MSYQREIILNSFQELVNRTFGKDLERIEDLKADASDRKIYRLYVNGKSLIGIYNDNKKENMAFVNFTNTFIGLGFNVPAIMNVSDDYLFYIEKDLGDLTLFKFLSNADKDSSAAYCKHSLADLIRFQVEARDRIDYSYCYQTGDFNIEVVRSDIEKFNDYFAPKFTGERLDEGTINTVLENAGRIITEVHGDFFLYRDFQTRNIMLKDNLLYYIDYQSGRRGPLQYDIASFLYSGSIDLSEDERKYLLDYYVNELNKYITYDKKEFENYFYYFAFLRLLQILGSYAIQNEKKKDVDVLKKIPKALFNLLSLKNKIDDIETKRLIEKITVSLS